MLVDLFLSGIGWLYLRVRYKQGDARQKALEEKYESSYTEAGFFLVAKPIGAIFLSLIALLVVAAIYSTYKFGLQ